MSRDHVQPVQRSTGDAETAPGAAYGAEAPFLELLARGVAAEACATTNTGPPPPAPASCGR